MPSPLRQRLRRIAVQVITLQATVLERFAPPSQNTNLRCLHTTATAAAFLRFIRRPSASAIEGVCARSAAEASLLQACLACPEGGTCAGKLSPPIAAKDWWGMDGDTLFTSCQIDVLNGRCLGSTNCSQVSTHARTSQNEQEGGTAWFDGLEGRFALDCTLRPVLSCSYTRAVFASGATTGTTLGSGSASSAPMASPGPRKTR